MITKKKLKKEIEHLKQDNAQLSLLIRAYIRSNHKLEDDIKLLNASVDAMAKERDRWKELAHKTDERRVAYVRANRKRAD